MPLTDPIAAYNAASNMEAHLICQALEADGIPAMVIEDVSTAGFWMLGTLPEIHKPQVWIERADADRAKLVLDAYESQAALRRTAAETSADPTPVVTVCEECGQEATFPSAQRGTVQVCPHCGEYIDVGGAMDIDGWDDAAWEEDESDEADTIADEHNVADEHNHNEDEDEEE